MKAVYQVHALHGTYLGFTYSTPEKAQAKCEELFKRNPNGNFVYYEVEVL